MGEYKLLKIFEINNILCNQGITCYTTLMRSSKQIHIFCERRIKNELQKEVEKGNFEK